MMSVGIRADITGNRFGRLVAEKNIGREPGIGILWLCKCDCGNEIVSSVRTLRSGNTRSCGCYQRQRASETKTVHGHGRGSRTRENRVWKNIKSRCFNPKTLGYGRYGGRGITMCDRWRESFENFLADMGPCPSPRHSIDRIDNDGNYEPMNCRWATASQQRRNRSDSKMTLDMVNEIRGRREHGESVASIARRVCLDPSYVRSIINREYWGDVP